MPNLAAAALTATRFRGPINLEWLGHPFSGIPMHVMRGINRTMRGILLGAGEPYLGPGFAASAPSGSTVSDVASGWKLSNTSASTGSGTVAQNHLGELVLTSGTTDEDNSSLQLASMAIRYSTTRKIVCFARVKVLTAATTDMFFGLAVGDTTLVAASAIGFTDGIGFFKAATATDVTFHVRNGSTSTTQAGGLTIADDTYFIIGFTITAGVIRMYAVADPNDRLLTSTENSLLGQGTNVAITNAPAITTDLQLSLMVGQEGGTTARKLTVDWAFFAENI